MKQLKLIGLILSVIWMHSCNQTAVKNEQPKVLEDWKLLQENGYTLQYPQDWTLDQSGQSGTSFIVLSQPSSPDDLFRENVNLLIQDLTGLNMDLDKYTEISMDQINMMLTNGNIIENVRRKADGSAFQKVVYTGDQGVFKIYCEQYYWVRDKKAYVLTLTCETDQLDSYKEIGEQILNSFKFDNN